MRYEFERDGTVVASVLWEGPGQVTVEANDPATKASGRPLPVLRGHLPDAASVGEELQMRRRDWTPWEFERACRNLSLGACARP